MLVKDWFKRPDAAMLLTPGICRYVHQRYDNSVYVQVELTQEGDIRVHLSLAQGRGKYVIAEIPYDWFAHDKYHLMYRAIDDAIAGEDTLT